MRLIKSNIKIDAKNRQEKQQRRDHHGKLVATAGCRQGCHLQPIHFCQKNWNFHKISLNLSQLIQILNIQSRFGLPFSMSSMWFDEAGIFCCDSIRADIIWFIHYYLYYRIRCIAPYQFLGCMRAHEMNCNSKCLWDEREKETERYWMQNRDPHYCTCTIQIHVLN